MAAWSVEMGQRNLAEATQNSYMREARCSLLYLETQGVGSLRTAEGASVLGFLESLRGRWAESSMWSAVLNLRAFLKFLDRDDLRGALDLANAKRHHGIFQPWSKRMREPFSGPAPGVLSRLGMLLSPCWHW